MLKKNLYGSIQHTVKGIHLSRHAISLLVRNILLISPSSKQLLRCYLDKVMSFRLENFPQAESTSKIISTFKHWSKAAVAFSRLMVNNILDDPENKLFKDEEQVACYTLRSVCLLLPKTRSDHSVLQLLPRGHDPEGGPGNKGQLLHQWIPPVCQALRSPWVDLPRFRYGE